MIGDYGSWRQELAVVEARSASGSHMEPLADSCSLGKDRLVLKSEFNTG